MAKKKFPHVWEELETKSVPRLFTTEHISAPSASYLVDAGVGKRRRRETIPIGPSITRDRLVMDLDQPVDILLPGGSVMTPVV